MIFRDSLFYEYGHYHAYLLEAKLKEGWSIVDYSILSPDTDSRRMTGATTFITAVITKPEKPIIEHRLLTTTLTGLTHVNKVIEDMEREGWSLTQIRSTLGWCNNDIHALLLERRIKVVVETGAVEIAPPEISELGKCPFCGDLTDASQELLICCGVCQAPHHQQCWNDNGGRCGIFGCTQGR